MSLLLLKLLLVLSTFAPIVSAIPLRQELFWKNRGGPHGLSLTDAPNATEWYTEQALDHFNPADERTWSQRYFANFEFYQAGGPVFLYIGGEGPLGAGSVTGRTVNFEFAKRTKGVTVALEHRFYGASQPFDSLETANLKYLTSRQALEDLAQFQRWFTKKHLLHSSKFFCMGGSYPGNLAAWYRLEFPEMTAGCWAASGPVHAVEDWPGFGQMVWKAMSTNELGDADAFPATKLYAGYEQLAALIQDPVSESFVQVQKRLNACPGSMVSQDDRDSWESSITTYPGTVMQYNNTKAPHLGKLKQIVMEAGTPLETAFAVTDFLNVTAGDDCADFSISSFYRQLGNVTLPADGTGNAGRTWTWQTCNEFGYFQTARGVYGEANFYTRGASSRSLWQQVCSDVFGLSEGAIGANIAATNAHYGGKDPKGISHVFFSNGELDAWSLLSITKYPKNNRSIETMVASLGSHCVGLYAPAEDELPGARDIREQAYTLFTAWSTSVSASNAEAAVFV